MVAPPDFRDYPRLRALLLWLLDSPAQDLSVDDLESARRRSAETGIHGVFEEFLRQSGAGGRPERIQQTQRTRFALIRHHLRELGAAINLPFILLKGEPLGRRLYGAGSLRSSGDLDLLVRREQVPEVVSAASRVGFVVPPDSEPNLYENNQFGLVHAQSGLLLEIHWALDLPRVPSPSFELCLEHARPDDGETDALVFDDALRLVQASYHLYHHAGFLKGMVDVMALLDVVGSAAVTEARQVASQIGVTGLVDWGLATAWLLTPAEQRRWRGGAALAVALGWLYRSRGVLRRDASISGAEFLGWKARDEERAPRALWGLGLSALLDDSVRRRELFWRTVFKDRRTVARELGRTPTSLEIAVRALARPAELARKAIGDLLSG